MVDRQEILLETGTNEVEIIEFLLGQQSFGVNVAKVREIVTYDPSVLTVIPDNHPSLMGMINIRNKTIPLVNLDTHLNRTHAPDGTRQIIMVCEFNELTNGFLVDGITQIHRISWDEFKPLSRFMEKGNQRITGSVTIGSQEVMILDLECIVADIYPDAALSYSPDDDESGLEGSAISARKESREEVRIILAEDSSVIRHSIEQILASVGYTHFFAFDNGLSALEAIQKLKAQAETEERPITDFLTILITDIEMPKMDGLTVCKKVKQELGLTTVKVVVFSSLINEQMAHKCNDVGADAYTTKPKAKELVGLIDGLCLAQGEEA